MKQEQMDAVHDFADQTVDLLRTERGVHAETAVAAAARMAGTFLFRSFGLHAPGIRPGQAVFSDEANAKGPLLVQIVGAVLAQQGIALGKDPTGKPPGPDHQPLLGFLESQKRLEPPFVAIKERYQLSWQEAAEAAAAATAVIIHWCAGVLDPNIAFNLAVYGVVEGAKTAPDPLHRDESEPP